MNISKAVQKQLAVLAVVSSVAEQSLGEPELQDPAMALMGWCSQAKERVALDNGLTLKAGELQLPDKEYRRWQHMVLELVQQVRDRFPGQEIDARRWTNAALLMAEDAADQVPDRPVQRKLLWTNIIAALNELYRRMDQDLEDQQAMEQGQQDGEALQAGLGS
ncbi:MAG: hypothetical protein ACOC43_09985 [Desulfohalobiaceae bacterium]